MKTALVIICVCAGYINLYAQEFEGTVKWSITTSFSDSTRQASMEKAIAESKNPKKIAPARPAAPEGKPGASNTNKPNQKVNKKKSDPYPYAMTVRAKNGNTLTKVDGGRAKETLFLKAKNQVYSFDRESKTYTPLPPTTKREKMTGPLQFEQTAEMQIILDYNCVKYTAISKDSKPVTYEIWATKEINDIDLTSLGKQWFVKFKWPMDKINGVPLRMVARNEDKTVTLQVIEIKKEVLDEKLFLFPEGYKQKSLYE
jgi:hypothetical protein